MSIKGTRTTTSYLEWDKFQFLLKSLESDREFKMLLLISIGTYTGLRISDILLRTWKDFQNDTMTITEVKTRRFSKTRKIKINRELKVIVDRVKNELEIQDDNHLFFSTDLKLKQSLKTMQIGI